MSLEDMLPSCLLRVCFECDKHLPRLMNLEVVLNEEEQSLCILGWVNKAALDVRYLFCCVAAVSEAEAIRTCKVP